LGERGGGVIVNEKLEKDAEKELNCFNIWGGKKFTKKEDRPCG